MKRLMFNIILLGLIISCLAPPLAGQEPEKERVLTMLVMQAISDWHYSPKPLDDRFSRQAFQLYLKNLDYNKKFFLKTDFERLQQYETQIDDQVSLGRTDLFGLALSLFRQRVQEVNGLTQEFLKQPLDLSQEESLELDPEKRDFCQNKAEWARLWRKIVKYEVLQHYLELLDQPKSNGGKLTQLQREQFQPYLEKQARAEVARNMRRSLERLLQKKREFYFAEYLNSLASTFDPHTSYFSPQDQEDFNIVISGSVEGIGVQIVEDGEIIKIESIVPGGPAWRNRQLQPGDTLLKVGQNAAEPIEVTNMSSSEVVRLIRGKKGTEVRLTVRKPNGQMLVIPLIRDVVLIEESYAKAAVLANQTKGKKIGYIYLPSFYHDINSNGGHNSATDLKRELIKLKQEQVVGVVLDLRNNGGGILMDAVRGAGFFIRSGPIVQVKEERQKNAQVYNDPDAGLLYDGPVVVLINTLSASASEILAAALQDYNRALIVGGPTSFGKGTVQSVLDLDGRLPRNLQHLRPLGSLKLTIQKFYRINGGSTQYQGVVPNIILPDQYYGVEIGERAMDYSLPWDKIKGASYHKWKNNKWNLTLIQKNSALRVQNSQAFQDLQQYLTAVKQQSEQTLKSLKLAKFLAEAEADRRLADSLKQEQQNQAYFQLVMPLTKTEQDAKQKEWLQQLNQDSYLNEATLILNDMLKK